MTLPVRGHVVAGRWELLDPAGAGASGIVWCAKDLASGGEVALKILSDDHVVREERFDHEATLLATLSHPNLVRYVAHGRDPDFGPWLVMEWLEGITLGRRLREGPLSLVEALHVGRCVASALGAIHDAGAVHRDVKPANVMLVGGLLEDVRLLDLGVARRLDAGTRIRTLTGTRATVGTLQYVAPEQCFAARTVGPPADVYGLGAVLYRCLSGVAPHAGAKVSDVLARALSEDPPPLSEIAPVPASMSRVVARMMARNPDDRPADGRRALETLDGLAADAGRGRATLDRGARATGLARPACVVTVHAPSGSASLDTLLPGDEGEATVTHMTDELSVVTFPHPRWAREAGALAERAAATSPDTTTAVTTGLVLHGPAGPGGEAVERCITSAAEAEEGTVSVDAETRAIAGDGEPLPFEGRERELAELSSLVRTALSSEGGTVAYVSGRWGIGRSRLLEELARTLQDVTIVPEPSDPSQGAGTVLLLDDGRSGDGEVVARVDRWLVGGGARLAIVAVDDDTAALWRALPGGRVELPRLPAAAVDRILERLGQPAAAAAVHAKRAAGLPIALAASVAVGADAPDPPAVVVADVLDRVGEPDAVLRVASLFHGPVRSEWLEALVPSEAVAGIRRAVERGALRRTASGGLVIADDRTREALAATWAPAHRTMEHRHIAAMLDADPSAPVRETAHHHDRAGNRATAIACYRRACLTALERGDHEAVVDAVQHALRLDPAKPARGDLLWRAALAHDIAGEPERAKRLAEQASTMLLGDSDTWAEIEAWLSART